MAEQFLMGVIGLGGGFVVSSGGGSLVIGLGIIPPVRGNHADAGSGSLV